MSLSDQFTKIAISLGDPAGIGPDIAVANSTQDNEAALIHFADPRLMENKIKELDLQVAIKEVKDIEQVTASKAGILQIFPIHNKHQARTGQRDPANTEYILECLNSALWHTTAGITGALVTGPINKGVINDAGIKFSGHTEYLAEALAVKTPVMMLASKSLKVVLLTTHLPIESVTRAITRERIIAIVNTVKTSFNELFKMPDPKICVCGLNPHAGDGGHLGSTDEQIIAPTILELADLGIDIVGPIPADSVFSRSERKKYDVIVAMYHDQGLAPLKAISFGNAVNITLGLPIIRTSVDHGTAYDIAGTGKADHSSFKEAVNCAISLALNPNYQLNRYK